MKRAREVKAAGEWDDAKAVDRVTLDAHERHRRRVVLTGERGTTFLLDLPRATTLRHGDGLVLDDGAIVRVAGRPEPLVEVAAADAHELARLAWHIGNRHIEVEIAGDRLRLKPDHVIEDMLRRLGARLSTVEAPFDPERGAYHSAEHHGGEPHDAEHHRGDNAHRHGGHHHGHDHDHE